MGGRRVFLRHLAIGDGREMGRYEVPSLRSFPGFGIGTILASFQRWGMELL